MKNLIATLCFALVMFLGQGAMAQHAGHGAPKPMEAPTWTQHPILMAASGFSRKGASYQAYYLHAMDAAAYPSYSASSVENLEDSHKKVAVDEDGELSLKMDGDGGYYLLRVVGHGPAGEVATASTFKYFSKPGPAPRDLLNAARPGFEIVPAVLPREHAQYRENETWPFRVRMNGKPVAQATVLLETSNGSKVEFATNNDGIVDVTLPGDFADIPKEKWSHGRPPASQFVLSVRDDALLATFNGEYRLDAFGNKNLWAGVGFTFLGMLAAFPLVRRRKQV